MININNIFHNYFYLFIFNNEELKKLFATNWNGKVFIRLIEKGRQHLMLCLMENPGINE